MKWFKHYTNAHKGGVFQEISHEFGRVNAYGWYFLLVEYLTDKWDGCTEPKFVIDRSELCRHLTATPSRLRRYLTAMARAGGLGFTENGRLWVLEFPKLLEIRHRDALSASIRLENSRQKSGVENNKKKNKNIYPDFLLTEFRRLAKKYTETFPNTTIGAGAEERFKSQINGHVDAALLETAMDHYRLYLDANDWRTPKTEFATFLGTSRSSFFWRGFIEKPNVTPLKPNRRETGGWD